jgi:hypothetical protein
MTGRVLKVTLCALLCAGTAAVAVRSAAVEAALESETAAVLPGWARGDPRIIFAGELAALATRTSLDGMTMGAVLRAADEAPLAEEPFIFAAIQALLGEDDAAAERLLEEARRRNPRSRVARLLLLDIYGRVGRAGETAREMMALSRLFPEARERLVPELARMAQEKGSLAAVAGALRTDPYFHGAVLHHLAVNGGDPDVVIALAAAQEPAPRGGEAPAWQSLFVDSLISRGETGRAVALWEQFSGRRLNPDGVSDGRFEGTSQFPPFGWKYYDSPDGAVEAGKGAGLEVDYYGRADATLAEQRLLLRPGTRYRLSFEAALLQKGADSRLAWKLSCHGDTGEFASVAIDRAGEPSTVALDFTVPPKCPSQWLRLIGSSSEFPETQGARIQSIRIDRAATQ